MKRASHGIGALGIALLLGAAALAQAPPMTNLQVFPKESPREQIIQTMNAFNESLGVQCSPCHVLEGSGGRNDFASDEKRESTTRSRRGHTRRWRRPEMLLRNSPVNRLMQV